MIGIPQFQIIIDITLQFANHLLYIQILYQRIMLLPQQLYPLLPYQINFWSPKDVQTWFKANAIETSPQFDFEQEHFDGMAFREVQPEYLIEQMGITSKILMKKIMEWLEHDLVQFEEYVEQQTINNKIQISKSQQPIRSINSELNSFQKNKQNTPKNSDQIVNLINPVKHNEAVISLQNVKKWNINKKRKPLSYEQKNYYSNQVSQIYQKKFSLHSQKQTPSDIKFVQSNYQICQSSLLFQYEQQLQQEQQLKNLKKSFVLKNSGKIGRNQCQVIILEPSVSRQHAQIIKMNSEFFLKDNNSKYGTFVQIGKDKRKSLEQDDILAFQEFQIQILKIKINNKKGFRNFDLKIKVFKEKEMIMNFYNKCFIFIGQSDKDINFKNTQIAPNHAKIVLQNNNKIYLVKQNGKSFIKLKKQEIYPLQSPTQTIRLGFQEVKITHIKEKKPILNISQFYPFKS